MASKIVAFRLPEPLIQSIEAQATAQGKSKTAVVIKALHQGLGLPNAELETTAVEKIQTWISRLEAKVNHLDQQLFQVKSDNLLPAGKPAAKKLLPTEIGPMNPNNCLQAVDRFHQELLDQTAQATPALIQLQQCLAWIEQQALNLDEMMVAYQAIAQRNQELARQNAELKGRLEQFQQ